MSLPCISILEGTILTPLETINHGHVFVQGPHISYVGPIRTDLQRESDIVIDGTGLYVLPGFIDIHTYGAFGVNTHRSDSSQLKQLSDLLPQCGVTSFLVSVAAGPENVIRHALQACHEAQDIVEGAELLGLYSEGLCANPAYQGAQRDVSQLCSHDAFLAALRDFPGTLRILMLAPEIPECWNLARQCVGMGILLALGHTGASFSEAKLAIEFGFRLVTHLFNAMPWMDKSNPGVMCAALLDDNIFVELIPDGVHVHPAYLALAFRTKPPDKIVVVTDSMQAAGLSSRGEFEFAGQIVYVDDKVARLKNGRPAASVLTMDQAIRNLLQVEGLALSHIIQSVTLNPARCLGIDDRKGQLRPGHDADLVLTDSALNVKLTLARGKLVFDARCNRAEQLSARNDHV